MVCGYDIRFYSAVIRYCFGMMAHGARESPARRATHRVCCTTRRMQSDSELPPEQHNHDLFPIRGHHQLPFTEAARHRTTSMKDATENSTPIPTKRYS